MSLNATTIKVEGENMETHHEIKQYESLELTDYIVTVFKDGLMIEQIVKEHDCLQDAGEIHKRTFRELEGHKDSKVVRDELEMFGGDE